MLLPGTAPSRLNAHSIRALLVIDREPARPVGPSQTYDIDAKHRTVYTGTLQLAPSSIQLLCKRRCKWQLPSRPQMAQMTGSALQLADMYSHDSLRTGKEHGAANGAADDHESRLAGVVAVVEHVPVASSSTAQ